MTPSRDPRVDPRPGDVVRENHGHRMVRHVVGLSTDGDVVRYTANAGDGILCVGIQPWRRWHRDSGIVKVAE